MSNDVTLSTHPRFILIEPKPTPARTGDGFQIVCPPSGQAEELLRSALSSRLIAVDFETKGSDYSLSPNETYIVGVGLAWDRGSCYLNPSELSDDNFNLLTELLTTHRGLLAHNVYFDGGWVRRDLGQHANWYACTYAMYMQLANEGWEGQKWSLKDAMTDVLMWGDTNETELDNWLVDNGYKKTNNAPKKEEMWRAPADILGQYCVLDAEATYLLMVEFFEPLLERFPRVLSYHQEDFLPHVMVHIDQKIHGIMTNRTQWEGHQHQLQSDISTLEAAFRSHPDVEPYVYEWEKAKYLELAAAEPEQFLKQKERKEPAQFLKDGKTVSKNWLKWKEATSIPPTVSKNWEKWRARMDSVEQGLDADYLFNIQSGDQLRGLLYDYLKYPVKLTTDSGQPAVGEDALKSMGEVGKLLIDRALRFKESSYLTDYLERTVSRPTIHPSFRMPGTVTGRLSGREPNLQQCFAPDTEALTPSGWRLIKELKANDTVWTIQPTTLLGQWAPVQFTTQREYSGDMVAIGLAGNTPLLVTPEHRLLLIGDLNHAAESERQRRVTISAYDLHKSRMKECMAHASLGPSTTTETHFSVGDVWLAAAVQADGSSARQNNPYVWRFGFRRKHKIEKFTQLVGREADYIDSRGTHIWYRVEFEHPLLTSDKKFNLSILGDNQIETFVEALSFWDGHKRDTAGGAFEFTSVHEDVVDGIQGLLVRHGYGVRKFKRTKAYTLYIRKGSHREYKKKHVTSVPYSGMVYCLGVETEHLVVRRGTSTYVTSQCPKTKGTLSGFISRSGHSFVDCDVNALEMVVTAELSQDDNLLALYGPNAKKNDIYLFYGALMPGLGEKIVAAGYDRLNPTPETIDAAKKACKKERSIAKLLILSDNYGSGVKKKQKILSLEGIDMPLDEVEAMHLALQEAKAGVNAYSDWLLNEWRANGGYVENAFGRPMCVDEKYTKDLLNRVVQSSGHDILQLYAKIARRLLDEAGVTWYPIVMDFHDEVIIEVPDAEVPAAVKILEKDAYQELNRQLGGTCPLKGSAAVSKNLAGIKLEE